ncbi:sugar phosphate isomerase/epimerase family protein [Flavitalea antarctica]
MKILFFCPRWGCETMSWKEFFSKVKEAGYDGVETGFPFTITAEEKKEITNGLKEHGLLAIGQHWQTVESDFEEHKKIFGQHLYSLAGLKPLFINSQTGKDYFTVAQNLALMQMADEISKETGVIILHETHRGKWSFAAHITHQYLQAAPQIRLTLDVSHWCAVAESLLEDQQPAVDLAIRHADHLHARVGFAEGPQVIDPRSRENDANLAAHLHWWDTLVDIKRKSGARTFTITPEYGAPPYQALLPYSGEAITSQWEINCWMKDLLRERYRQ